MTAGTASKYKGNGLQHMDDQMSETITVLLVDEDQDILDLTATFLEREAEAFEVQTATSTTAALELLEAEPEAIDTVVSDYTMPESTGEEFLDAVREQDPDMPFFFFTGRDRSELERALGDRSITGYVQKGTGTARYGELAADIFDAVENRK